MGKGGKPPCKFFQKGTCTAGENCKFSHPRQTPDEMTMRMQMQHARQEQPRQEKPRQEQPREEPVPEESKKRREKTIRREREQSSQSGGRMRTLRVRPDTESVEIPPYKPHIENPSDNDPRYYISDFDKPLQFKKIEKYQKQL